MGFPPPLVHCCHTMSWTFTERYPLLIPPGTHLPGYLLLAWRFASNVYWEEELGNMSGWSGITEAKHILLLHGVAGYIYPRRFNEHASGHTTHALIFFLQHQTQSTRFPFGFKFPLSLPYIDAFARLGAVSLRVYTLRLPVFARSKSNWFSQFNGIPYQH